MGSDHHQRWWANLLINGFFWFSISLAALFFYALNYAVEASWSAIDQAMLRGHVAFLAHRWGRDHLCFGGRALFPCTPFVPLDGFNRFTMNTWSWKGTRRYTWMPLKQGAVDNPNYDHIIAGKQPYFVPLGSSGLRTLGYVGDFLDFRSFVPKMVVARG